MSGLGLTTCQNFQIGPRYNSSLSGHYKSCVCISDPFKGCFKFSNACILFLQHTAYMLSINSLRNMLRTIGIPCFNRKFENLLRARALGRLVRHEFSKRSGSSSMISEWPQNLMRCRFTKSIMKRKVRGLSCRLPWDMNCLLPLKSTKAIVLRSITCKNPSGPPLCCVYG